MFLAAVGMVGVLLAATALFAQTVVAGLWQYLFGSRGVWLGADAGAGMNAASSEAFFWTPILLGLGGAGCLTLAWVLIVTSERRGRKVATRTRRSTSSAPPQYYRKYRR